MIGAMIILTKLMKPSPKRFQVFTEIRFRPADQNTDKDGDQNLDVEDAVPGLLGSSVLHETNCLESSQPEQGVARRVDRRIRG